MPARFPVRGFKIFNRAKFLKKMLVCFHEKESRALLRKGYSTSATIVVELVVGVDVVDVVVVVVAKTTPAAQ